MLSFILSFVLFVPCGLLWVWFFVAWTSPRLMKTRKSSSDARKSESALLEQIQSESKFKYTPLQHGRIRLVRVDRDSTKEFIRLTIKHAALVEPIIEYTALSYRWGDEKAYANIYIRHENEKAHAPCVVSQNVYDFFSTLIQLEPGTTAKWLWIDQLCINQRDIIEKQHQIAMMADLYSEASLVVIWLGKSFKGSDEVMNMFTFGNSTKHDRNARKRALNKLLDMEYWSRVWICQEIVLARDVRIQLGSRRISWSHFTQHLKLLSAPERHPNWPRIWELEDVRQNLRDFKKSEKGLTIMKWRNCALVHDKIYGALGLLPFGVHVRPDYSLSPKELMHQVLHAISDMIVIGKPAFQSVGIGAPVTWTCWRIAKFTCIMRKILDLESTVSLSETHNIVWDELRRGLEARYFNLRLNLSEQIRWRATAAAMTAAGIANSLQLDDREAYVEPTDKLFAVLKGG